MKQTERPGLRRWSRHEYARLIDHHFLDEADPVELVDGLLLVKEPQHSRHRTAVILVARALERAFGDGWFVQVQSPIILDDHSEPEPDVCVVRGSPRDYTAEHPMRPALVVEVADAGLRLARGRKAAAYARAIATLPLTQSTYTSDWTLCWKNRCRTLGALVPSATEGSVVDLIACNAPGEPDKAP